jgi:hypothetical protein
MEIKKEQVKLIIEIIEEFKNILDNEYSDILSVDEESILKSLKEQLTLTDVVRQSEQLVCSCGSIKVQTTGGSQCQPLLISDVISRLKFKLEVNAGRLCEPILKQCKNPKDDAECHKAFLMLAHLEAIEDYLNGL